MRPLRLDMAGFGVFRDETTVDFTDADFFALVGPTGSGKSTVLDAMCFALYGRVPRWGDARSVAAALAPSSNEARVRLTFETAGERFVATRVVRRDGKGRVKTGAAGLQRMPPGFDPRRFDTGLTPDDLGEVLAGTPSEMDAAVPEVLGLPYDQFVTCVVLPQGEFAEFLHAKPATRQQILVNLLNLSVYGSIRERAVARASKAEAELTAAQRLLTDLADADKAALARAESRLSAVTTLAEAVEEALPQLAAAQADRDRAAGRLQEHDAQIAALAAVQPPKSVAALAEAAATARAALAAATEAVTQAEEQEEKHRAALANAGDAAALRVLLKAHEERQRLATQAATVNEAVAAAQQEHTAASEALAAARADAEKTAAELEAAREAYTRAQTADLAAAVRTHLVAGQPCPVCEQPVSTTPPVPADSAVARAEEAGKAARARADAAARRLQERDAALRALDRTLAAARAQADTLADRLAELDAQLADAPGPESLRRDLARITEAKQRLDEATGAVRAARESHRRAQSEVESAEHQLRAGWREFDQVRDALAPHGPPSVDRDDLAAAWASLATWASERAEALRKERPQVAATVTAAEQTVAEARAAIAERFAEAEVPAPDDEAGYARAVAVAVERARAERDRLVERRAQADELRRRCGEYERDMQVARTLAQHLRANNFEAWVLEEALDRLVEGASRILRELSGGQYDLAHDEREFWVVDHHDAGLRRSVRTLSGGETFQASLALALALSEQLAGLATTSASLESILLDEGFGTLDAATLDAVAATLENLAARGDRMVGVVTHVAGLAERVPVRFEVSKDTRSARIKRVGW